MALGLFAAAAAKSLQSCPTLCDHIDGSPPGSSSLHGIFQARVLKWGAIGLFMSSQKPAPRILHSTQRIWAQKGREFRGRVGEVVSSR